MDITEEYTPIQIPHSPTTEKAVLGGVMLDPNSMPTLGLHPGDFYIVRNQYVWAALQELSAAKETIDYLTVCAILDKRGHLDEIGGRAYVMELISACVSSMHVSSYAAILKEKASRRKVVETAQALVHSAYDKDSNISTAISRAMDALSKTVVTDKGVKHIGDTLSIIYDEIVEAAKNPKSIYGISTGLAGWDKIDHGLQPGTVIKLSGEPGVGKSLLACQILAYASDNGHPGALYEFEMGASQVVRRLISSESRITTYKMQSGYMKDEDWHTLTTAIENLASRPIYMTSDPMDTVELRADLHRAKDLYGIEVVVIDYEALLMDDDGRDETERGNNKSSRVHSIAKDLNLAMLVVDDMTKAGIQGTVKGKGGLAGGARKLHDADEIVLITKSEDTTKPNLFLATWDKNREGTKGMCAPLVRLPDFPVFADFTPERTK